MTPRYNFNTSFIDLLFNSLLLLAGMFFLSWTLIKPKEQDKKPGIEMKAEFIITTTWPPDRDDDVDSYLEDPADHLCFFKRREDGLMHLDRDDLGVRNDFITINGNTAKYEYNQEMITIRGIVPGEYTMNIHMYHKNSTGPTPVTVKIEKINPTISLVYTKTLTLEEMGEEKTVCRFTLDQFGNVIGTNELSKKFTNKESVLGNQSQDLDSFQLVPFPQGLR